VRIVDPDGNDVAVGEDGEIVGRPDLERTGRYLGSDGDRALPLDADGWYHTGDIGRLDEHGILSVTGRIKEMLVVGGFNVFPAEVEDVLRASPRVSDAVVVSVPDDRLGELPVAALVLAGGDADFDAAVAEATAAAREQLAAYKVPRRWFPITEVPLNSNGKLDRMEVARLAVAALDSGIAS
jgi:acyl-CoA synthetase (AMP-forming)/AMP-acid ligase II